MRKSWLLVYGGFGILLGEQHPAAHADCWQTTEDRFGVSRYLLLAIAETESAMNPSAISHNPDGSVDIGLMQVNSRWLPALAAQGISMADLLDPCTSLEVGAWILAGNFVRYGYNWRAIGAYNARTESLRMRYAWQISRKLKMLAKEYPLETHGTTR